MDADYDDFITLVQQKADLSRERAERATRAVLETLGERLSGGEARDIAERLPPPLVSYLDVHGDAEPFRVDEFLRRVAEREAVDVSTAERHARAVFTALGRVVGEDEVADMKAELPKDFEPLLAEAEGRFVHVWPIEAFVGQVADRAGLFPADARRAVNAVLETLGERLAGGEVEDLVAELPPELHAPLRQGNTLSNGAARRMSLEQFVRRVAEREGVTPDVAQEHTRAVFATLREAVTEKEFLDMTAQLPREFAAVAAKP